ncbi:MAG: Serine-tRNA ligase [Candidatus Woesebacteria bacterium GW2011_GWA1_37_8]|uniref:Serine--tRNA ligase n=2 Tax=Candidatus Woeseibacteriota TaxID=1752722 RepID=A0A0G0I5V4_9BACT|nr:MAG: Serine-tRNA ligase [Microgenomates group bacterium GW2011_GWC1_37_12b]KKQ46360.1 MAG: Serine-tRNA ligase [Candidatus Woesebacteria bacterium GW2011_GWA1_37_8]
MLDIQIIRDNPDKIKKGVTDKNYDPALVDKVLELDGKKRELLSQVEKLRADRNTAAKNKDIESGKRLKVELQKLEPELEKIDSEYFEILKKLPNPAADDVKIGKDDTENKVIRKWGEPTKFNFKPFDHVGIGEKLGLINIEKAGKITGTRFGYLMGEAVLIEYAIVQLVFETLTNESTLREIANKVEEGYNPKPFIPVVPPVMIKPEVFDRMGRLYPKEERYYIPSDDVYLIGSAEHTLGPLHMDETLLEKDLPIRYIGFSTAFRREAGSYGKDTKGILRVHQFDKLEMESFTTSENGQKEQYFIVAIQEYLMQKLNLPYQVVEICTGDMGGPDYRQMDIETWLPGQDKYRETHTSDYMTDYQSRRLNTKVRKGDKTEFVYMNDATAFAIGRIVIAILENYQNEDGSVTVPEVLRKWIGKEKIEVRKQDSL